MKILVIETEIVSLNNMIVSLNNMIVFVFFATDRVLNGSQQVLTTMVFGVLKLMNLY